MQYQNDIIYYRITEHLNLFVMAKNISIHQEQEYNGGYLNGFLMIFIDIILWVGFIALIALGANYENPWIFTLAALDFISAIIFSCGFAKLEPNEAKVLTFFGKYVGTFRKTGFYWINPFMSVKNVSLRARNLNAEPIKVNDKTGNPILIGLVVVWKLNERRAMAGLEVIEARINYLAYAPEIAAVMLRRQQAAAIITAREKIVDGAVSMVKMALDKLSSEQVVELDDEKKAAMVCNLLVMLCADEPAQPVINSGTLNH